MKAHIFDFLLNALGKPGDKVWKNLSSPDSRMGCNYAALLTVTGRDDYGDIDFNYGAPGLHVRRYKRRQDAKAACTKMNRPLARILLARALRGEG